MASRSSRALAAVWAAGTCALLLPSLADWTRKGVPRQVASTPVDFVNPLYARQWRLLQQAAAVIPSGESYTTTARQPDHEMLLFMLSQAALPDRVAFPTSYWGMQQALGRRATYVVAYECVDLPTQPHRLRRFEEGCVFAREGRGR